MPHIIVEYSQNLEQRIDVQGLLDALHETAIASGVFPLGGARTRAARREAYTIADGHPDNAYVHVQLRIGHGRDEETKRSAAQALFDTATAYLAQDFARNPLGISLELVEIDPAYSFKQNNLHEYVKRRSS